MKPKVTIGMCLKNVEDTVYDAVNSVLAQDFPCELIELIVVDGQSTDRTLKVVKDILAESNVESIILRENKGLGFARQMVVENATGDYIVWVDGDMILPKDFVRRQVEFIEQNPKVGIASARHGILPGARLVALLEDVAYIAVEHKFRGSASSRFPGTAGSIFRTKAIRQVGGFDPYIRGVGEDFEASYRVREAGWLIHIGTDAVFFEKRKENWKRLWDHYFWYGSGSYEVYIKLSNRTSLLWLNPIAGFFAGVWYSIIAYKLFNKTRVFLLPFHYAFKRLAWCWGFVKTQKDSAKTKLP